MYDVSKLKTVDDCRTVMERAKQQGLDQIYKAVFQRQCELAGNKNDEPNDTLVKEFHEAIAAYEQLLTEKNGKTTLASRTRQKVKNKGVLQTLIEWTRSKSETPGFKQLIDVGLPQYTGEYIVAKYASRFPQDAVALARNRLKHYGVELPQEQI